MPRYEFSEGSSNKFWEIKLSGKSFTTTYGKIGTAGQTSLKEYGSSAEAQKEYDKLVKEKTKKGYELVGDGGGGDDDEEEEVEEKPTKKVAAKVAAPKVAAKGSSNGSRSTPRRFEFSEGSSNKFWEIWMEDTSVMTKYGRIGSDGSQTVKDFGDEAKAEKEYDKLVNEKTKKGYEEQSGGGGKKAAARDEDDDDEDDDDEDEKPAKKAAAAKPAVKAKGTANGGGDRETPRYFEFSEGSSNKFWQIWLEGTSVMTKYGRIGASGSQTVKDFGDDAKALKEYDKLVNEKTKKGYEEKDSPD
jgi:predicted DNA-binding WGR domain protein